MIRSKHFFVILVALLFLLIITAGSVFSQAPAGSTGQNQMGQQGQQAQSGQQGQQGQPGQMGQMGMRGQGMQSEQMQAMIAQALKQALGATDEEWTVLEPKVLKVFTLVSSQSTGFQMRNLMQRGNQRNTQDNAQADTQGNMPGMSSSNRPSSFTENTTLEELRTLLESEDTTPTQLKNKVAEVRKEREQARQDLAKAQKELRELLTLKQEAILITYGMLE